MNAPRLIASLIATTLATLLPTHCVAEPEDLPPAKPNVLFILVDDLGWQDVGCYDIDEPCPYDTPHLDALARDGVKFWQAYSPAPTCAPSRGAVLAGRHPVRLQRTHVVGGAPPIPNHEAAWPLISPWYAGRLPISETILPEALKANGYTSGHVGKWHIAINHNAYPQPIDHGFDWTRSERGATIPMKPHRTSDFATTDKDDPYRLDEDGFPFHQNSEDALDFMRAHKDKPFLLYYATWLVHTPIHTRSEALLRKYCKKMNLPFPKDGTVHMDKPGQNNPYYGAMVEMLDHYVGDAVTYLKTTDDPRWPGHKLIDNTYIIFTSDNGGMESHPGEIITDNYPLDKGKIHAQEGGIRVPLIITGPGIKGGQETDVMANGLDIYPTILSWTGTEKPADQALDGADLSTLLSQDPTDPTLVKNPDGSVRNHMMHHFPNSATMHSTLRVDGFKLIRNYKPDRPPFELYRLYKKDGKTRVDIEESNNLAEKFPERTKAMDNQLQTILDEMEADYPYRNPFSRHKIPNKDGVCKIIKTGKDGEEVWATFEEQGNKMQRADLLVTTNGGHRYEEWMKFDAKVVGNKVTATLPEGATHYIFNLIDEHNYLVSHPRMGSMGDYTRSQYSVKAFAVGK